MREREREREGESTVDKEEITAVLIAKVIFPLPLLPSDEALDMEECRRPRSESSTGVGDEVNSTVSYLDRHYPQHRVVSYYYILLLPHDSEPRARLMPSIGRN